MKSTRWTHKSQGCLPQTGNWQVNDFRNYVPDYVPTTPLSHPPQRALRPDALTLPLGTPGGREKPEIGSVRGRSTHCWEALQSRGKWSWPCCCKFLAISPKLSLDLLLATGFSCHESEYHTLKKKINKKGKLLYHFRKIRFYFFIAKRSNNSFLGYKFLTQHTKRKHHAES